MSYERNREKKKSPELKGCPGQQPKLRVENVPKMQEDLGKSNRYSGKNVRADQG